MFPAKKAIASSRPFFILHDDDLQKIADAAACAGAASRGLIDVKSTNRRHHLCTYFKM